MLARRVEEDLAAEALNLTFSIFSSSPQVKGEISWLMTESVKLNFRPVKAFKLPVRACTKASQNLGLGS